MTLTFYTNPMSRGRTARIMLEEIGQPYETHILQFGPDLQDPAYLAINPMGKVPAIVHDGHVVTECAAICAYLAEAFPSAGLAPRPDERADYYRWLFFGAGPIESAITAKALDVQIPEDRKAMPGWRDVETTADILAAHLADRPWLCGDRFTAADVYTGSAIDWGVAFGNLPARPALDAYIERFRARPAYVRAAEIDDALIKG